MRKYLWLVILPFALYYIGAALNILVITVNHGTMPVAMPLAEAQQCIKLFGDVFCRDIPPGTLLDHVHATWASGVRFGFLADWIQVPWLGVCSPGDLFLWLGDWMQPYCIGGFVALSFIDPAVVRE